mmetsp:Transcript_29637/g.72068  ORF Transcript_29637/g.72068 Transcript_29637/m.72068 type:complete len:500 (+) Transcript_29637:280-1779(+)
MVVHRTARKIQKDQFFWRVALMEVGVQASLIFVLLLCSLVSVKAESQWFVAPETAAPYMTTGPDGEPTSSTRCAKVTTRAKPRGREPSYRSLNTPDSASFWQTVYGPRNNYVRLPEEVDESLWAFLGGDTQLFFQFTNRQGSQVNFFASQRCLVLVNSSSEADESATGFYLADTLPPAVLVLPQRIPGLREAPITPIVEGMMPGLPFPSSASMSNWTAHRQELDLSAIPDLEVFRRDVSVPLNMVDYNFSRNELSEVLPTLSFTEESCRAWIDAETQLPPDPDALHAVEGVFQGNAICDREEGVAFTVSQVGTELWFSPNVPVQPLLITQGLFLVVLPALWELTLAALLLLSRISRQTTLQKSLRARVKWLIFELTTLSVSLGEFGLLVSTTVEQSSWQPCQITRGRGSRAVATGEDLKYLGSAEDIFDIVEDVTVLECYRDPGTDLKWAIIIGVVAILHTVVLTGEWIYLSWPRFRNSMNVWVRSWRSDPEANIEYAP